MSTDVIGILPIANGGTNASTSAAALTNLGALGTTLTNGNIFVGSAGNLANGVAMSGDATITNTGALTLSAGSVSGGTAGDIVDASITDADISVAAAIAGTKVTPNFGSQNVSTSGTLTTGTAGAFSVDGTGNITKIRNLATSFPTVQGVANSVLTNDGAGVLTWNPPAASFSTLNYIPKGNGTTLVASTIFDNGTLVGIGTATPVATLDVNGGSTGIRVQGFGVNGNGLTMVNTDGVTQQWSTLALGTSGLLGPSKGFSISDVTNSTNPLVIEPSTPNNTLYLDNAGSIGIGTTTPGAKLEIAGQIKITGGAPGVGKVLTSDAAGLATWGSGSGWGLTGNSGTTSVNFIGTTDNVPFNVRVNGQKAGVIDNTLNPQR